MYHQIYASLLNCALPRLRVLPIINTGLRARAPLLSSITALHVFDLACFVLLLLKGRICFVCALQITIHPPSVSLLSFILPYKGVLHAFFPFFCFKPLVTPLFLQLFYNNIYVSSKKKEVDLMKTVQLLDFHFIPNCLKAFLKVRSYANHIITDK